MANERISLLQHKARGSAYIFVLILLITASIFVVVLYRSLNINILQYSAEKKTVRLEKLAASGLDKVTQEFLANPDVIVNDPDSQVLLSEIGVCGQSNAFPQEQKCSDTSTVLIEKINQIRGYLLKNGETLQVNLAGNGQPPVSGGRATIEIHTNPNAGEDLMLVTAFYLDTATNTLKARGACVVHYNSAGSSVSAVSCIGGLTGASDTPDADFGRTRVRIAPSAGQSVSFYRLKLLTKGTAPVFTSVTGADFGDLPFAQQLILKAVVYSIDNEAQTVEVKRTRAVMLSTSFPEVFDWVLYSGGVNSIVK